MIDAKKTNSRVTRCFGLVLVALGVGAGPATRASGPVPTLWLVGDSTMKNGTPGEQGWGERLSPFFDPAKIRVENRAAGGRSSRTFMTEGRWDKILAEAKPGDYVIIQLGHNDGGPLDDATRSRGTIRGVGDETRDIENSLTHKHETVHTYGWYLRKYVRDARDKKLIPVICTPVPHCPKDPVKAGELEKSGYVGWSKQVADAEGMPLIQLNGMMMDKYAAMTPGQIKATMFTPADNTHTSPAGAEINAECVVAGVRGLEGCGLADDLVPAAGK